MKRILLCYEIPVSGGKATGNLFFSCEALTESSLSEAERKILRNLKNTHPNLEPTGSIIWLSVTRLDA